MAATMSFAMLPGPSAKKFSRQNALNSHLAVKLTGKKSLPSMVSSGTMTTPPTTGRSAVLRSRGPPRRPPPLATDSGADSATDGQTESACESGCPCAGVGDLGDSSPIVLSRNV
eukprot:792165-Pyramimonas_sp.AAC.1